MRLMVPDRKEVLILALESYKKWIILVLILVFTGVVIIATISSHKQKAERTQRKSTVSATSSKGPLMGDITDKVVPVEELGVNMTDPKDLAILGDKYFESSRFDQAIEIYQKVIELNPNDVDTYNDLGLAYYYKGSSDLAVDTLRKGTEVIPSYQRIWLSLGYVLMSTGRNEEARPVLEKAAELAPDSTVGKEAKRMLGLVKE